MNDVLITALAVMFLSLVVCAFCLFIGWIMYHGIGVFKQHRKLRKRKHLKLVKK